MSPKRFPNRSLKNIKVERKCIVERVKCRQSEMFWYLNTDTASCLIRRFRGCLEVLCQESLRYFFFTFLKTEEIEDEGKEPVFGMCIF